MPYKDKEKQLACQRDYNARKRPIRKEVIDKLKSAPCVDCKLKYPPVCMDFHHKDPSTKLFEPNSGCCSRSLKAVLNEIAKCELVCANCHRIRTQNSGYPWQVRRRKARHVKIYP